MINGIRNNGHNNAAHRAIKIADANLDLRSFIIDFNI
jgi:hypothetical protein